MSGEQQGLNLNTASREELVALPGIGPSLAARIEAQRPYLTEEDLLEVNGIGEAALARIRPMLAFNNLAVVSQPVPAGEREAQGGADEVGHEPKLLTSRGADMEEMEEAHLNKGISGVAPGDQTSGEVDAAMPADELAAARLEPDLPGVANQERPVYHSEPDSEDAQVITDPGVPMQKPLQQTPASVPALTKTPSPAPFNRSSMLWLLAGTSFASVIAAVLATLLVLVLVNGTLRIDRHEGILALNSQVQTLAADLEVLEGNLNTAQEKLAALEGLSGRMTLVESGIESIQGQVDQAAEDVTRMQTAVVALEDTTSELTGRVGIFDMFFDGLQDLLGSVFDGQLPAGESSE